jgi:hypothetical protein
VRARLVKTCRDRQTAIARQEDAADPGRWERQMRTRQVAELAWGRAYQKAYWDFESAQIAGGVPLDKPDYYTAFFAGRSPIA